MSFSYHSSQEIWRREGGRELAKCFSCGVLYRDGFNLDCSHLSHKRDSDYDDPKNGVLECLKCHLKRHVGIYFRAACLDKKKRVQQEKFSCLSICYRIIMGEGKWTNNQEVSKIKVKFIKRRIVNVILEAGYYHREEVMFDGFTQLQIKDGMKAIQDLIVLID